MRAFFVFVRKREGRDKLIDCTYSPRDFQLFAFHMNPIDVDVVFVCYCCIRFVFVYHCRSRESKAKHIFVHPPPPPPCERYSPVISSQTDRRTRRDDEASKEKKLMVRMRDSFTHTHTHMRARRFECSSFPPIRHTLPHLASAGFQDFAVVSSNQLIVDALLCFDTGMLNEFTDGLFKLVYA